MPKYLVQASYTAEGLKGLQKDGASARVQAVRNAAEMLGGKCEAMYWTFGEQDVVVIFDLPTTVDMAALAFTVSASGLLHTKTTQLITASEVDSALKKTVNFRPPGR